MRRIFKIILFILLSQIAMNVFAQEHLTNDLRSNPTLHSAYIKWIQNIPQQADSLGNSTLPSLGLPFKDEFNQRSFFPNPHKWVDKKVFINSSYSSDPWSVGVATFDGLNENGYPYNSTNPTAQGLADSLTSYPIDLQGTDSVYLSFAYQPQGVGNAPEPEDSLILEFYNPSTDTWQEQWSMPGSSVKPFKQVLIYVDTVYYHDKFQFRFMNYATLSGALDIWNLDYVYLNSNRTYDDTTLYDIAFQYQPKMLINNYTSMPYTHFKADTSGNMKESVDFTFKNNTSTTQNVFYKQKIFDRFGNLLNEFPVGGGTFFIINPDTDYTISIPVDSAPRNFAFNKIDSCSNIYTIENYFNIGNGTSKDDWPTNDTVIQQQIFNPYYAYDDGTAEAAYYLESSGDEVAVKYNTNISDTLRAIDIYFDPAVNNVSGYTFHLDVWSSLNPETKIYTSPTVLYPQYTHINDFMRYELSTPIVVNGTFYIGWDKVSPQPLDIGFDLNDDNHDKLFYNIGSGWVNSSFSGTLMIRPVFGSCKAIPTSVKKLNNTFSKLKLYPNPADNKITVAGMSAEKTSQIVIYNINGRKIYEKSLRKSRIEINTSGFSSGLYLIMVYSQSQILMQKKIIISH